MTVLSAYLANCSPAFSNPLSNLQHTRLARNREMDVPCGIPIDARLRKDPMILCSSGVIRKPF